MSGSDPGVQVAPGDPAQISRAAAWHQELADAFELHHATITGATNAVLATWNGEAASSYARLATVVANHFIAASGDARTVSGSLFRYARELEHYQQQGMHALQQSEHWLLQQSDWQTKLDDANRAIANANRQIGDAQKAMGSRGPAGIHPEAAAELHAGQVALATAQAEQATAERQLQDAEREVMRWQAVGRRAWDEAIQAARQATGDAEAVNVAPPPLAGWPRRDRFNTPYPYHGEGSPAGPHGAIWARPGHWKPPAKPGYRIQGTGDGGWIYIPLHLAAQQKQDQQVTQTQEVQAREQQAQARYQQSTSPARPVVSDPSPVVDPVNTRASGATVVGGITMGELTQIGKLHGWTGQQIADWASVCRSESNGTVTDTNPSSGAYGIAQFIDGPSEYAQYGGNANTVAGQLVAMANYIAQRYGNPSAAWSWHLAHNWY